PASIPRRIDALLLAGVLDQHGLYSRPHALVNGPERIDVLFRANAVFQAFHETDRNGPCAVMDQASLHGITPSPGRDHGLFPWSCAIVSACPVAGQVDIGG